MTTQRFMVDECGTLIDMYTRDTFDYVSDVCGLLNEITEENEQLKLFIKSLGSPDGRIWLANGYVYRIDKILNDFNNI